MIIWGSIFIGYIIATYLSLNYRHEEKKGYLT